MYTVNRISNPQFENTYNYELRDNDKSMILSFQGNLDFYMSAISYKDNRDKKISFTITKENYAIYSLFDELFRDIEECNIFSVDETRLEFMDDEDEIKEYYERIERMNRDLKTYSAYKRLIKRNLITWKSDDRDYGEPDFVKIYRGEDAFYITFVRQSEELHMGTVVRFRNSGSSYDPFNIPFMKFFNKLQEYDPEYHQIHIEEVILQKKLTK